MRAKRIGKFVFSLAKNKICKIFIQTKAGKPSANIIKTLEVSMVSLLSNKYLSKSTIIISYDNYINPIDAGIASIRDNSRDLFCISCIVCGLFFLISFDSLGSKTIPIEIPIKARGSW